MSPVTQTAAATQSSAMRSDAVLQRANPLTPEHRCPQAAGPVFPSQPRELGNGPHSPTLWKQKRKMEPLSPHKGQDRAAPLPWDLWQHSPGRRGCGFGSPAACRVTWAPPVIGGFPTNVSYRLGPQNGASPPLPSLGMGRKSVLYLAGREIQLVYGKCRMPT